MAWGAPPTARWNWPTNALKKQQLAPFAQHTMELAPRSSQETTPGSMGTAVHGADPQLPQLLLPKPPMLQSKVFVCWTCGRLLFPSLIPWSFHGGAAIVSAANAAVAAAAVVINTLEYNRRSIVKNQYLGVQSALHNKESLPWNTIGAP